MTETSMPRVVTTIADFRTAIRSSVHERIPGLRAHHGRPARRPRNPVASRH